MSYPARGPALAGINGKASQANRRRHCTLHFDALSEAAR